MDAGDRDILVQGKAVLASYGLNVTESPSIVSATFADSANSPDAFTFAFIAPGRNIAYIAWTCKRRVPPERRAAVTEFFTRANFGMIVGGFVLDWNDGEYRYTASVDLCRIGYGSTAERTDRRSILEDHFLRSRTVYLRYREAIIRTIEGLPAEASVFSVEDQTRLGIICRALQSMDLKYVIMNKERMAAFPYTVDNDEYTFTNIVGLRSRNDSVVYCMCSPREPTFEVPPSMVRAAIEFFHRANFGLNVGGFEFDLDDNTFRFTGSVDVSQLGVGEEADKAIDALTVQLIKLCMLTYMRYMAGVKELMAGVAPAAAVAYAEMPEAGRPPPSRSPSRDLGGMDTPTVRRTGSPSASAASNDALVQLMRLMGLDASNPQVAQLLRAVVDTNSSGGSGGGNSGGNSGGRSPGNSSGGRITELPPDPNDGGDDSEHSLKRSEVDLQGEIGRGGMGIVYRGTYFGGAVAVKEIQGQSISAADEAQFLKEIRLQSKLQFMNVVRVFGAVKDTPAGSNKPRWLLVTEFCELGNLGELLNHREHGPKLTNPVLLRMMTEVAQGMNFLHGRNVLHLDIKPLNIFVSEGYHAKIGDFGLSTVVSTTIGFVPHSQVLGLTLMYSPPELLAQRGDGASKAADVYAFAISLNHVFARQVPYSNLPAFRNQMLLRDLIATGTRPTLAAAIAGNAILRGIVEKGWHDSPAQRPTFQSIRDQLSSVRL